MLEIIIAGMWLVAIIMTLVDPTNGAAFEVKPLIHDLESVGRRTTSTIVVTDPSYQPLLTEITVNQRVFDDAGVQELVSADDDLLVFPPLASIAPGATQSIRIQWLGDPQIAEPYVSPGWSRAARDTGGSERAGSKILSLMISNDGNSYFSSKSSLGRSNIILTGEEKSVGGNESGRIRDREYRSLCVCLALNRERSPPRLNAVS